MADARASFQSFQANASESELAAANGAELTSTMCELQVQRQRAARGVSPRYKAPFRQDER
jgi:hypothetical protein